MQDINNINVDSMTEEQAGECFVYDLDNARLVLATYVARQNGDVEPVLYNDPSPSTYKKQDDDILAQVVEIQIRMDHGLELIKEKENNPEYIKIKDGYKSAKEAFQKAKDIMFAPSNEGKKLPQKWWDRFNQLKAERNGWYNLLVEKREELEIQHYWNHWNTLKAECVALIGNDNTIWAAFFQIEDKEEWILDYLNEENNKDDRAHKKSNPEVDTRMLTSDEAYYESHMEELYQF